MIQRGEALDEAAFDVLPFLGGDDAGDEIEGEDALGAFIAAVNGKGDALIQVGFLGQLALAFKLALLHLAESLGQQAVVWADLARSRKHFIEKVPDFVILKQPIH